MAKAKANQFADHAVTGNLSFDDFDLFRDALKGWDTEPIQLGSGPLRLDYDFINFADLSIARMHINRLLVDPCAQDPGWYNFVICLNRFVFCGIDVSPGHLMVFGPGREYRNIVPEGWRSVEISVSEDLFHATNLQVPGYSGIAPELSVLPLRNEIFAGFRRLEQFGFRQDIVNGSSGPSFQTALRETALDLLERALADARWAYTDNSDLRLITGFELTQTAMRLIEESDPDDVSAREIAGSLGVSLRTLQLAFKRAGLCGPTQYMLARRLNLVRREVVGNGNAGHSVTTAAMEHGFSHLGRFSQHYRRLFGESPSRTLRRANKAKKNS